jgi:endo-beta-N-acetylglucosaminidase D
MNPSLHWVQLVNQTMAQRRCTHSEAWRITASAHPEAATLMSAAGRSRSTVQFFNSREAQKITPEKAQAKKEFFQFVNEREKAGQHPNMAYNAAAREHPDLVAAMAGGNFVRVVLPRAQFANAADGGKAPAATAMLKKLFWLPDNATEEHFQAAFQGNGSALSPQNPSKIFAGLVDLTQKNSGSDYDTAIAHTKAAFPELWNAVDRLSKEPV